jgi:diguanylate cyclase (GGDEF)-like protein/PAS domain S-box-containing protein
MILKSFIASCDDTLPISATVEQAIEAMNNQRLNYVVLIEENKPCAIVTERDILNAFHNGELHVEIEAKNIGTMHPIKANGERSIDYALSLMIDHQLRRIIVVDNYGNYLGVVQQETIIYHFEPEAFSTKMKLQEFLHKTTKALTVDQECTIKEATTIMSANRIGSVLVCKESEPIGILTESDILRNASNEKLAKLTCKELMTKPLVFFDLQEDVKTVLEQMQSRRIRRIAIHDSQKNNYFIATTRDILRNLQGGYSAFLEKKLYASRMLFDQMEELMIEVLVLEDSYVVGWANGAAKKALGLSVDDDIKMHLPQDLWNATLSAFDDGKTHVEDSVDIGEKTFRYSASEVNILSTRVIKLLFSDISTIHQLNVELNTELIENKTLYEETFNQKAIGIGYISEDGIIMDVNPYIEELLGYSKEELIGKNIANVSHSDDMSTSHMAWNKLKEKKGHFTETFQKRYRKKSGDWVWVEVHLSALWSDSGKFMHMVGFIQDITKRHEDQEALVSQKKLLSTVMDSAEDLIFYKDINHRYLGGNEAWYKYNNLTPSQAIGRRDDEIHTQEVAQSIMSNDKQVIDSRRRMVFKEETIDCRGRKAVFEVFKSPLIDENGKVFGLVGIAHDVGEKIEQEKRQRLAQSVFDNTAEGIMVTDKNQIITSINPAFTAITGYGEDEAIGRHVRMLSSGKHEKKFYEKMWEKIESKAYWRGEIWNMRKNKEVYPGLLTISKVKDSSGEVTNYIGVFSDITLVKSTQEKLEYVSHHDPLTMLPNRLLLEARLEHSIEWAKRDQFKIAVLFLDLDHFKEINDAFGHSAGDEVLVKVALRLKNLLRHKDTISRIGGDEFVIMIEDYEDLMYLEKTIQAILALFEKPVNIKEHSFNLTCSIGAALYPNDGEDTEALIKNADAAMYQAKESGRNTYTFYTSEITHTLFEKMLMENEMRRAVELGEFILYYQPQIDMRSGVVMGVEALARWKHPGMGLIMPDRFIPLAESSKLIIPIGRKLLEQACLQAKKWVDEGRCPKGWKMAVNISAVQMIHDDLYETVLNATKNAGLNPSFLELELTETYIMDNPKESRLIMQKLKTLGITFAIDDFGIGYSSLSYLKQFPIDCLKVDRSFIRDIPEDADDVAISKAILALAKSLGLEVLAEGVENEIQKSFLLQEGCYLAQGYLYSPPKVAQEIERDYETFKWEFSK